MRGCRGDTMRLGRSPPLYIVLCRFPISTPGKKALVR